MNAMRTPAVGVAVSFGLLAVAVTSTAAPAPRDKKAKAANPVSWETKVVTLKADDFAIEAGRVTFTAKGRKVEVRSDPGTPSYRTLELTWQEGGVEMRLNLYLEADDKSWWVSEIRTYDGAAPGNWVTYKGVVCKADRGKPFKGDVELPSPPGAKVAGKVRLRGLELRGF